MLQTKIHQLVKLILEYSPSLARTVLVKTEMEEAWDQVEVAVLLALVQIVQIAPKRVDLPYFTIRTSMVYLKSHIRPLNSKNLTR